MKIQNIAHFPLIAVGAFRAYGALAASATAVVTGIAVLATPSLASAQEFPTKPVRFIVPFAPGNSSEVYMRAIAPRLQALWKQPVTIENRPGAAAQIGTEYVARSEPDGHTLLVGSQSTAMGKLVSKTIKFDPQVELVPVHKIMNYKIVLATNAQTKAKVKNLTEFVAYSNTQPGGVFFGGTGTSSVFNVANAIVAGGMNIKYASVDYPGQSQFLLGLLRDDVQFVLNPPNGLKQYIEAGTVFPLAALSEERFSDMPDLPTVREMGYKAYLPLLWNGVFAPKGTPQSVVDKISRDMLTVSFAPDFKDTIEPQVSGTMPRSNPQVFAKELDTETKQWKEFFARIKFEPQ